METDRMHKNTVPDDLEGDPNYLAYKVQEAKLREKFMGKWVAFVGGRLVIAEEDKSVLFNLLDDGYPEQREFVHQIGDDEPVDLSRAVIF